ncbi:MAG: helix-turn-helix domain-containing protein [Tunicatimonas sp.]
MDYQVIEHPRQTLFFINKEQIHYFCLDARNEGYLFHFDDFFLSRFSTESNSRLSLTLFSEIGMPCVSLTDSNSSVLEAITSFIQVELANQKFLYQEQVFYYFQTILTQVERLRKQQNLPSVDADKEYVLAIAFKNLVYDHLAAFHSIDYYTAALHTNSKKLTQVCKRYLSATPGAVIRQVKVLEAQRLLANQDVTIQEVAYAVGFEQPTYFTKYFKQAVGMTPKYFQQSIR